MSQAQQKPPLPSTSVFQFLGWLPLGWFTFFVISPLVFVFILSFLSRGSYGQVEWIFTFKNYIRLIEPSYALIFFRTCVFAFQVSFFALLITGPLAWGLATLTPNLKKWILFLIIVPFLSNLIIRVYSLRLFVSESGVLQQTLHFFQIPFDPFTLMQNQGLVFYAMLTTYLPFMFFPIYVAFEKFDYDQVEAAQDLGAGPWTTFFKIIWPQLRPAIVAGWSLVFIPCLGEFIIPDLLGGAKVMLMGNLITEKFLKARDWPMGASLSIVFLAALFFFYWFFSLWAQPPKWKKGARST